MKRVPGKQSADDGLLARTPLAAVPARTVAAVAVAAAVAAGAAIWRYQPVSADEFALEDAQDVEDTRQSAPEDGGISGAPEPQAVVVVDVAGAVASPGVYELAEGSRVIDAVEAAGGASDGAVTVTVNLARVLQDGEQVVIPTQDEVESAAAQPAAAADSATSLVNINTAGSDELESLPGIGPATAQKILDDRARNGPFSAPEDLKRVSGIGDKKYEQLADWITV